MACWVEICGAPGAGMVGTWVRICGVPGWFVDYGYDLDLDGLGLRLLFEFWIAALDCGSGFSFTVT
jgi:hypothetical protein